MKHKKLVIILLSVLIIIIFNQVFLTTFTNTNLYFQNQMYVNTEKVDSQKLFDKIWNLIAKEYYEISYNHQNWYRWKRHYQDKIKTDDDLRVAVDTMLSSLNEPYTRFMSKDDYKNLATSITSRIYGIGVNIYSNSGKIEIFNVVPMTPADFAQLKKGDIILSIDGKDIGGKSVSEVAELVRGPENSIVELLILRDSKKINKKLKRKEIKIKNIKSSIIDNHIGYIKIASFISSSIPNEFMEALENIDSADSIILDLRGNTGGLMDNALFIAQMFIDKGALVNIIYRNGNTKSIMSHSVLDRLDKPLVVLVNGASASASEILSGALKDYHRATLVGKTTFGKGLIQKVIPLPNETGINITIAKYHTPNGTDIHKHGIIPDVIIGDDYDVFMNQKDDIQLQKAKEILNDKTRIGSIK